MIRQHCTLQDSYCHEARRLDEEFLKASFRSEFIIPRDENGNELVYVCGNSLGPQPRTFSEVIQNESDVWAKYGVVGHLHNPNGHNWVDLDSFMLDDFKRLVGASDRNEVCVASSLTTNLHNLLIFFYHPTSERYKIITDGHSFPSDYLALEAQIRLHGLDPKETLIEVGCDENFLIDDEAIVRTIKEHAKETALVMFSGVHYLSGQVFDMQRIAEAAKAAGCIVGLDLAHAIGNVPIMLSEWDVDFAVWCTYKYLSSGPGGTGGFFVNRRHHRGIAERKSNILAGWWGVDSRNRFMMEHNFDAYEGARAFQQSCSPVFNTCGLVASMKTFRRVNMDACLARSRQLTRYFRELVGACPSLRINAEIITPPDSGAQLSLKFSSREIAVQVFEHFSSLGVIVDRREPSIIRVTFTGLYNSHEDVYLTFLALKEFFNKKQP